jgi:hypothetical protein
MPEIKCPSCNATHHIGFRELVDKRQVFTFRITTKQGSLIRAELFAESIRAFTEYAQEVTKVQGNPLVGYIVGVNLGDGFAEVELAFLEMATEEDVKNSVQPMDGG